MIDTQLTMKPRRLSKAAVALGGFLIMVGILLIGVTSLFSMADVTVGSEYRMLFMWVLLTVSVCDIVAGVILVSR